MRLVVTSLVINYSFLCFTFKVDSIVFLTSGKLETPLINDKSQYMSNVLV